MTVPTEQKALVLPVKQGEFVVDTRPVPKPSPGELLVRNEASGLNPVDWKIQAFGAIVTKYPAVLGIDAAGVVAATGEGVAQHTLGDKVLYQGSLNIDHATFQQYTLVKAGFAGKLAKSLTFEQGASIPLAIATAAVGLYNQPGGTLFTPPWAEGGRGKYSGKPMVVMGGSSAVGSLAIQLSKLSGFSPIITTASLKNTALLEGYGATHVLDRYLSASALREEVLKITDEPVSAVYDAISLPETQNAAFDLLAPGGKLLVVLGDAVNDDKKKNANGRTVVPVAGTIQIPQNAEFGKALYASLTGLLESGDIKPLVVEVIPGGLGSIPKGLDKLKNNQVSATKLIVRPVETA
ncbi:GroES-like protein [Pilatotrama ljubarskyi]|nr:GroES-like protein [Pilatotrama ljubarskyi]